jgi:RNA 2',3'-cyclic 3'-phosphodiesterase
MRTIRSFIAVNLGINAVRAVADEEARLRRAASARGLDVRWIAPQNLHVTLAFLGQVTEPMVEAIEDGLEPITRKLAPFELVAKGLGVFPDAAQPRVVWVGLEDPGGSLVRLHFAVSEVLGRMGFSLDDTPFRSHVTIGRVKGGDADSLAACLAEAGEKTYGAFNVRDVACYRSDLRPTGADYQMMWRLGLGVRPRGPKPGETVRAAAAAGGLSGASRAPEFADEAADAMADEMADTMADAEGRFSDDGADAMADGFADDGENKE